MEKWKRFERLTAALHKLRMAGAEVKWDDSINGYQIDVSVRFRGGVYNFLMIVECRDKNRPASREEIAAFVIKREQTGADKGVFVSAAGFQSGARKLAADRGIDVFTLTETLDDWPETIQQTVPGGFVAVRRIWLRARRRQQWQLVKEDFGPALYARAQLVGARGAKRTLYSVAKPFFPKDWLERVGIWRVLVDLTGDWNIRVPGLMLDMAIDGVLLDLETIREPIVLSAHMPPELRTTTVQYRNERTAEVEKIPVRDLPFGLDSVPESGHFYRDVEGREYYCEAMAGDDVHLVLLGSVQHGRRLWVNFTITFETFGQHYAEITGTSERRRLREAYNEWLEAKNSGRTISAEPVFQNDERNSIIVRSETFRNDF